MCYPFETWPQADNFIIINFHYYSLMIHFVIVSAKKGNEKAESELLMLAFLAAIDVTGPQ